MTIDESLDKYFENGDIYQKRFEKVEETRKDCPWLTNNKNTMLGTVDTHYLSIVKIVMKAMKQYNNGISVLIDARKGKKIEKEIIDQTIENMEGLDNHLDKLSNFMKNTFIPFYQGMKNTQNALLEISKLDDFFKKYQ